MSKDTTVFTRTTAPTGGAKHIRNKTAEVSMGPGGKLLAIAPPNSHPIGSHWLSTWAISRMMEMSIPHSGLINSLLCWGLSSPGATGSETTDINMRGGQVWNLTSVFQLARYGSHCQVLRALGEGPM